MAIELDNSFTVPVPPERAWDVLMDVERIAPCMPGASVTSVEGDEIAGQVKVKLGPLSLSYKGTAKFTERDQASRSIAIEASGKETRGAGTASATVHAGLKPADAEDQTLVSIHTSLNVTGRPAQFGRSLLPEVSAKLIGQFATNLEALISQDAAPAPAGSAPAGASPAEGTALEGTAPESASPDAAPAESAPEEGTAEEGAASESTASEGGVSAEGAAETTTAAQAASPAAPAETAPASFQQEDSLNLVKLVGVPVLKRVVPALAGAVVFALIGKRIRRRFGSK